MNRREAIRRTAAITGLAVTSTITSGILKGCKPSGDPDWVPKFLSIDEVRLVSAISNTILPTTDTPGALDVYVPEFIDLMLADNVSETEQAKFREELNVFAESVNSKYSKPFDKCEEEQRKLLIGEEEERSYEQFYQTFKKNSYLMLKEFTLLGFYTSEYVMNNMLNYQPIPGRYDGCIPLGTDGKVYVGNPLMSFF